MPPRNEAALLVGALPGRLQLPQGEAPLLLREGHLHRGEGHRQPGLPAPVLLPVPGPPGRRLRRPRRLRHRRLPRPPARRGRGQGPRVHRAPLPRRRQAARPGRGPRPRPEVLQGRARAAAARQARHQHLGEDADPGQEGRRGRGQGAASSSTPGARPSRATPSRSGGPWDEEFGKTFEYEETDDQLRLHPRDPRRHGARDLDGPAPLRRRRLRQDRGGHAGRLQGRHGRQAGRRPLPDDRPGQPAPQDLPRPHGPLPGPRSRP
ncbi:MAG: hypothetical protein MZV64_50070 [Ignavibacteriales bacterium]|nr:hypothetical protein [Ignavibacteriales bacterium]